MEPLRFGHSLGCFQDLSQHLAAHPVRQEATPLEWGLQWDSPAARGSVNHVQVRPGLGLMAMNLVQSQPWSVDVVHEPTALEIGFHRANSLEITHENGTDLGVRADQFYVGKVSAPTRLRLRSREGANRSVTLQTSVHELRELFGEEALPPGFEQVVNSDSGFASVQRRSTSAMDSIVDELSLCTLTGPMRRLYFESKSLELIVLAAQALGETEAHASELPRAQIERLEYARELLLQELQRPPSLRELARRCGLNERKLKEGFKRRFGTTVFGFVRHQRLTQARELLRGDASVMVVAQTVGYANPSKFAAAFRREFGIAPSTLLA